MYHTPGEGFHRHIDDISAVAADLQHGGHGKTGACMSVVLDHQLRVFFLNGFHQLAEFGGAANASHVLQSDFLGTVFHIFIDHGEIVFERVHGRVGNAEGGLRNEAEFVGVFDGEFQVAVVVEAAERAHHIDALGLFDLEHQATHVGGHGVHAQAVEGTFQHLALNAGGAQGFRPFTDGAVRVLAVHQVHLLEGSAIGLHAVETAHFHNHRGDFRQLVHSGLILPRRLPHVTIHQTKSDSLFHTLPLLYLSVNQ